MSAGRTLALTKSGRLAVLVLNTTDKQMVLRKGQKIAYALPAKSKVAEVNVAENSCPKAESQGCQGSRVDNVEGELKSIASLINSEATLSSGRSFFPGKEKLKQPDVIPDLFDLKNRLTAKQLDKLRTV